MDGDAISIMAFRRLWIDHCSLSYCRDGLIDVTLGSTAVTMSKNYFSHHDKAVLLGRRDCNEMDDRMQETVPLDRFGEAQEQRVPRCRPGYFHVVNNDYMLEGMYAIGSANPTVNSQGNRYLAPPSMNAREVKRRIDAKDEDCARWNWLIEGEVMLKGAYFVPSGDGLGPEYTLASSAEPRSAGFIDQLAMNAVALLPTRFTVGGVTNSLPYGLPNSQVPSGISNDRVRSGDEMNGVNDGGGGASTGAGGLDSCGGGGVPAAGGSSYGNWNFFGTTTYGSSAGRPPPPSATSILDPLLTLVLYIIISSDRVLPLLW